MKAIGCVLILMSAVQGQEPSIVFDNRPELGVPTEALAQEDMKSPLVPSRSLYELTDGTLKTIRIRYFNKDTWATEDQAREYVRGFLADKSSEIYGSQVWSQVVGVSASLRTPFVNQLFPRRSDKIQATLQIMWVADAVH